MIIRLLLILFLFIFNNVTAEVHIRMDSLKNELESAIAAKSEYEMNKQGVIKSIQSRLHKTNLNDNDRYYIHEQLINEYQAYNCDSAYRYILQNIQIAQRVQNKEWLYRSEIKKAYMLSVEGLYTEALAVINEIPQNQLSRELLYDYYRTYELLYLYLSEYTSYPEFRDTYNKRMNEYQDSVLTVVSPESHLYHSTKASQYIYRQEHEKAKEILLNCQSHLDPQSHDYAINTSTLAFIYFLQGEHELRKAYLMMSSIADIKSVTKENKSLRELAEILFQENEIQTADRYMKLSMEDANFFNARLRNVQAAHMLPIIDNIYQQEKDRQHQKLQWMLFIISIMAIVLLTVIFIVMRQIKTVTNARKNIEEVNKQLELMNAELSSANQLQQSTNDALTESNQVKEEYLGRFLDLCSEYIDKLESYHRMLNNKAASGKIDDLFKTLKSSQFIDDELNDFYKNFDTAFLKIYPDFVDKFNELLPETDKIVPKQMGRLTTELRIFALIRLGINDSGKIAKFLRSSVRTIYCYRSKLRGISVFHDDFDDRVMKIGN